MLFGYILWDGLVAECASNYFVNNRLVALSTRYMSWNSEFFFTLHSIKVPLFNILKKFDGENAHRGGVAKTS